MNTTYTLDQLKELAVERFEKLGVDKLFATSDGQFFLLENRAQMHAGPKGKVHELINENAGADGVPVISINELKVRVANEKDLQSLTDMMLHEVGTTNRSEAVNAIQVRIDEVNNSATHDAHKERKRIIEELTTSGVDYDKDADTEELKVRLEEYKEEQANLPQALEIKGSIKDMTPVINECTDVAVLEATKDAEAAGENRSGLLKVIDERIEELNQ